MAKLHELLAVDQNLKGQALKCRTDLTDTMTKKRHLFEEKLVTFTPDAEGKEAETTAQSTLNTTVRQEVVWLSKILGKAIDCSYAIDLANTHAKADIVLDDGTVIAKDVPTTALLQLEHRVREVLEFVKQVPTLDPAKGFEADAQRGSGVYKARAITKPKTQKVESHIVVVQPTKEHPAQVVKESKDVRIGLIQELEWSGFVTPATKADMLERGESLLRAVTQARSRANTSEIDAGAYKIGHKLLEYVFQPVTA